MERKEYRMMAKRIIHESFPKLKTRIIFLSKGRVFNLKYSAVVIYFILFSWIVVHPKVDNYPKNSLNALLAHELAHLDIIANKNFFEKIKFGFSWMLTKKGKENFEKDADTLTVVKGYGKSLIELHKASKRTYTKEELSKMRKGYLSENEIKKLMRKNGNSYRN